MARGIVAVDGSTDNWPMRSRIARRLAVMLVLAMCAGACSPMPNPNPSSPANQLNGVGSPNQLPIGTAAP